MGIVINLLRALILLPTILSLEFPTGPDPFQFQPTSYYGTGNASRSVFEETILKSRKATNGFIPPVCDGAVRVATYNVHHHKCLQDKEDNIEDVQDDLISINPSIVIFQAVDADGPERTKFEKMLQELGYSSRAFEEEDYPGRGNMIASKIPLSNHTRLRLSHISVVVVADFEVDKNRIAVLGTRLGAGSRNTRYLQTEKIMRYMEDEIAPNYDQYILAGGTSSRWDSREISALAKGGSYIESFANMESHGEDWYGISVDFIFASELLSEKLIKTYAYQTEASNYLPVIADFKLSKVAIEGLGVRPRPAKSPRVKREIVKETNWRIWVIAISVILVIGVAAAIAFFYYRQRSKS